MAKRHELARVPASSRRNSKAGGIRKACVEALEGRVLLAGQDVTMDQIGHWGGTALAVQVVGTTAYLGQGPNLVMVDVGDPASPHELGHILLPSRVLGVTVVGNNAYIADGPGGLQIVDVSNPADPKLIGMNDAVGDVQEVSVVGAYAYMAADSGLQIANISNPAAPTSLGMYPTDYWAYDVSVVGNYAYLAAVGGGLQIINISDPPAPMLSGTYQGYADSVEVVGNYAYVAEFWSGLNIIDISNPSAPTLRATCPTNNSPREICVVGNYAYVPGVGGSAGPAGLVIINVANPVSPTLVGSYEISALAFGVSVVNNYAYLAAGEHGLQILNVSSPAAPTLSGTYQTSGTANDVDIAGSYVYMADEFYGLEIISISDPALPTLVGVYDTSGGAYGVKVAGNYAYVADGRYLQIINISNPASPTLASTFSTLGSSRGVAVAGNFAYVSEMDGSLEIVNISNPMAPTLAGRYDTGYYAWGVSVVGNYAYVVNGRLQIIDVSNPAAPVLVGTCGPGMDSYAVAVSELGDYAYIGDMTGGLQIIDTSNPAAPRLVGTYNDCGGTSDIAVVGDRVYLTAEELGLRIFDVSNPAVPTLVTLCCTRWGVQAVAVMGAMACLATRNCGMVALQTTYSPTYLELSNSTIAEKRPLGTSVGVFGITGRVPAGTVTYSLASGDGSVDDGAFTIVGDTLYTAVAFHYRPRNRLYIRVRATDQGGLYTEKLFAIAVTESNVAPTDIGLSANVVTENQPWRTDVGVFSTSDQDTGETFGYTLVSGSGSADNGLFEIVCNTLRTAAVFDYESRNSYSIRVRSTDEGGLYTEKTFTIAITDVNEPPTDINLSNGSIAENEPSGTTVGTFSTVDSDTGSTFVYSLVSGAGSADIDLFSISGNTLKTAAIFDYEVINNFSIRVRSTDESGLYTEKVFTIIVTDANDAPVDINLSNKSVSESQPPGTTVGMFSTSDSNVGDTFSYSFVGGTGGTDNDSFTILGSTLKTAAVFDYQGKSTYSIRVRSTDQGGLYKEKVFSIAVTKANATPSDVLLSASVMAENQASGTAAGMLSTTDPDVGNTFTYGLVSGTGSEDNASFTIIGSTLQARLSFDYEAKSSYSIRVRTTDQGGLWFEKAFTITVSDVNETPTSVGLSSSSIAENQAVGTAVGVLSTSDPDGGNTFTYGLVSGTGSSDNDAFQIVGDQLQTAASFDYEVKNSYSIRIRTTDQGGLWFEKAFTISVSNVNETPTDVVLSNASVAENQATGTVVGSLSSSDQDAGDTFIYSLVAGDGSDDNASVTVSGNQLLTAGPFDYETKDSYSIRIRSSDAGGLCFEKAVTITVADVNEAPRMWSSPAQGCRRTSRLGRWWGHCLLLIRMQERRSRMP